MVEIADKNRFLINKIINKSNSALLCLIGMIAGFLCSRVLCSIATFLFGVSMLWGINPKLWFKNKWWLLGLAWVVFYALSYFNSSNKALWGIALQIKLPFLLLPLAFSYMPSFTLQQIRILTISIGVLLVAGACYSVSFLITDYYYIMTEYRVSHLLPTPARGDHIRFSLAIVLYIIWAISVFKSLANKYLQLIVGVCIALLFVYIHILAAKSGLVSLYVFVIIYSIYLIFTKKRIIGLLIVILVPIIIYIAINFIPTLTKRFNYIAYTFEMFQKGDKSGDYGDIGRLYSYKIATQIIKQYPFFGVGTGDMLNEMSLIYEKEYAEIPKENRLLPHNQFLIVALGCGLPAMALFIIWFFYPLLLLRRNKESFYFFLVWFLLFIQLMIEPALEIQYGVLVFLFFLLIQKQLLRK